jgi:hypothetical protein
MKNVLLSAPLVMLALAWTGAALGKDERGCAILPPYESPDPPGFNSANGDIGRKGGFLPYYSPIVPISRRWASKQVVPYYPGYCRNGKQGCGAGCEEGVPGGSCDGTTGSPFDYGIFTGSTGTDAAQLGRMGGNGLVPYGAPQAPLPGPDLIDLIKVPRDPLGPGCP